MNQPQREALLDLMTLAVFADEHLSLEENAALQTVLGELGWESSTPREIFIYLSMGRARKASTSPEAVAEYLRQRTALFPEAEDKAQVFRTLERLVAADGVAASEKSFLEQLRAGLA